MASNALASCAVLNMMRVFANGASQSGRILVVVAVEAERIAWLNQV